MSAVSMPLLGVKMGVDKKGIDAKPQNKSQQLALLIGTLDQLVRFLVIRSSCLEFGASMLVYVPVESAQSHFCVGECFKLLNGL